MSFFKRKQETPKQRAERFDKALQEDLWLPDAVERCERLFLLLTEARNEQAHEELKIKETFRKSDLFDKAVKGAFTVGTLVVMGAGGVALTGAMAGALALSIATPAVGVMCFVGLAKIIMDGRFAQSLTRISETIEALGRAEEKIAARRQSILEDAPISEFRASPRLGDFLQNTCDAPQRLKDAFDEAQRERIRIESTTLQKPLRILKPIRVKVHSLSGG